MPETLIYIGVAAVTATPQKATAHGGTRATSHEPPTTNRQ